MPPRRPIRFMTTKLRLTDGGCARPDGSSKVILPRDANVPSGTTAGTIASGSQVNSAQLGSPESAGYASGVPVGAGCGPGGRGFESRRSPSSYLQITIFCVVGDRRGDNGGDNF